MPRRRQAGACTRRQVRAQRSQRQTVPIRDPQCHHLRHSSRIVSCDIAGTGWAPGRSPPPTGVAQVPAVAGRPSGGSHRKATGLRSEVVQTGDRSGQERAPRIRRRDRHGRGLRGGLAPPGVPLHRTRAERFDDLVLQAVARLEPRWEAHLAGVEFAVEEIPPTGDARVPLARLESGPPGSPTGPGQADAGLSHDVGSDREADTSHDADTTHDASTTHDADTSHGCAPGDRALEGAGHPPPRIVVYRRPLMARADTDEDLGELVFEVVVEEFARLLGLDPEDVDPGYPAED